MLKVGKNLLVFPSKRKLILGSDKYKVLSHLPENLVGNSCIL